MSYTVFGPSYAHYPVFHLRHLLLCRPKAQWQHLLGMTLPRALIAASIDPQVWATGTLTRTRRVTGKCTMVTHLVHQNLRSLTVVDPYQDLQQVTSSLSFSGNINKAMQRIA